jgi:hypothetical protein
MLKKTHTRKTRKKPYSRPELTVHGDVEEITKSLRLTVVRGQATSEAIINPDV